MELFLNIFVKNESNYLKHCNPFIITVVERVKIICVCNSFEKLKSYKESNKKMKHLKIIYSLLTN